MTGRTIVITGASSGIGASAAATLAAQGWQVAVVGRDRDRTEAVAARTGGTAFLADYGRLDDVAGLANRLLDRYPRISVLANNAGGLVARRRYTVDGFEQTFQQNHLAPFLLTALLLPRLLESGARVITTASLANRFGSLRLDDLDFGKRAWFGGWRAYGTSKIMAILFAREFARRTKLDSFAFHPGYVATAFGRESFLVRLGAALVPGGLGIPVEQGAAPIVHLASVAEVDAPNGTYFDGLDPHGSTNPQARDDALASRLWDHSARILAGAGWG